MTIDVIIPNYNGSQLIQKNVPAVIAALSSYKNSHIIIVDDGSRPKEQTKLAEIVETLKSKSSVPIILIENPHNVGFSSNMNRGIQRSSADLLVFLNSDVSPKKDFLGFILPHFEKDEKLFGVGCLDKSVEGSKIVERGRGVGKWLRGFLAHSKGSVDKSDTLWISGGSSVVRSSILNNVLKGFDSLFDPFYWEDIDLSFRAQKAGYHILFENRSIVEHRHEEGAIKTHFKSQKIQTIAYRNQFTFIWKNITDSGFLISHILWLPYYSVKTLLTGDTAFLHGFFLAIFRLPAILKKRKAQEATYTLSDREILSKFIDR